MNVLDKAYIISWLGKKDVVQQRLELLKKSVGWCRSKNLDVIIVAMDWSPEYVCSELDKCDIIFVPFRMPPAAARNFALNHFYGTEDDYCIILDDDTWIEKGDCLIDTLRETKSTDLDLISVLCPATESHMYKHKEKVKLVPLTKIVSGVFIVKNLQKHYGTELFFNTGFKVLEGANYTLIYGEDVNFVHRQIEKGLKGWLAVTSMANSQRKRWVTPSTWMDEDLEWRDLEPLGPLEGYVGAMARKEFGKIPSPVGEVRIL